MVRDERDTHLRLGNIVAEILKIVGQRLRATAKADVHPDPNLIAAFAERSLARPERLRVMDHLAQCADCREIVSLSIPQLEDTAVVTTARGISGWLSWPMLRWGALAACVVVVGVAVTLRHPGTETAQPSNVARQPDTVAEGKPAMGAQIAQPSASSLTANLAPPSLSEARSDADASPATKRLASKPVNPSGAASSAAVGDFARPKLPSPSQRAGSMLARTPKTAEQSAVADSNLSEMADARPSAELSELVPGRAKDAPEEAQSAKAKAATGGAMVSGSDIAAAAPQVMNGASLRTVPNLAPRWTLSADGTLQRSLDSGRSWKTITVSNRTIFRALAASGLDIWVAGSGGALYHSSDAGEHWMRVQPVASGETLTADIIGVEFTDALHGKLTTSNQESWTTADSGQTWQKQQ